MRFKPSIDSSSNLFLESNSDIFSNLIILVVIFLFVSFLANYLGNYLKAVVANKSWKIVQIIVLIFISVIIIYP